MASVARALLGSGQQSKRVPITRKVCASVGDTSPQQQRQQSLLQVPDTLPVSRRAG